MKSVYALIPAALLAGTVHSAPVEEKRMEDPSVHADRLDATHKYFKTKVAKKPGNIIRIGDAKPHRTRHIADAARTTGAKFHRYKLAGLKKRKSIVVA